MSQLLTSDQRASTYFTQLGQDHRTQKVGREGLEGSSEGGQNGGLLLLGLLQNGLEGSHGVDRTTGKELALGNTVDDDTHVGDEGQLRANGVLEETWNVVQGQGEDRLDLVGVGEGILIGNVDELGGGAISLLSQGEQLPGDAAEGPDIRGIGEVAGLGRQLGGGVVDVWGTDVLVALLVDRKGSEKHTWLPSLMKVLKVPLEPSPG